MNGGELLVRTARDCGIEICLANAGTTEMPLVMALDREPGIKAVLGLFEGVCTGAADGYGRLAGRPAMTLLHLGPGLANGIANLHNARRASAPIFNVIGEHATWHQAADPPLAMPIAALAGTVSGWVRTNRGPETLARDVAEGIAASRLGQIASLIVPHDHQLTPVAEPAAPPASEARSNPVDEQAVKAAAGLLRRYPRCALLLGNRALRADCLALAARIAARTGCRLMAGMFAACMDRGSGLPLVERVPYFPEPAQVVMKGFEAAILVGAPEPVTFFGYPGTPSAILPAGLPRLHLCDALQDARAALALLAERLEGTGPVKEIPSAPPAAPFTPQGRLTPATVCRTLAAVQPAGAVIVEEGLTTAFFDYYPLSVGAAPHTLLTICGGSIGFGPPSATGAALACPDRPVINIQADGSALYTVQALWTQAREGLNVTTLICNNRGYHILKVELERAGVTTQGPNAQALIDIAGPELDWVKLANGFGVPAVAVDNAVDLARAIRRGVAEAGPFLVDMRL